MYVRLLFIACAIATLSGCATHKPDQTETFVYRHGFEAVQVTAIKPSWTNAGKEIVTRCPWNQLAKMALDGKYYCPIDGTVEGMRAIREPLVITGNYASMVIPAAGQAASGAFMGLGVGLGLANMPATQISQTASTTMNTMPGARFSTGYFNTTPAPSWLGQ